jgi:hemerythrin
MRRRWLSKRERKSWSRLEFRHFKTDSLFRRKIGNGKRQKHRREGECLKRKVVKIKKKQSKRKTKSKRESALKKTAKDKS